MGVPFLPTSFEKKVEVDELFAPLSVPGLAPLLTGQLLLPFISGVRMEDCCCSGFVSGDGGENAVAGTPTEVASNKTNGGRTPVDLEILDIFDLPDPL